MPPPDGIIVLGGALRGARERGPRPGRLQRGRAGGGGGDSGQALSERARDLHAAETARCWPRSSTEAQEARKLLIELGVDPSRITLEDASRNTDENARFTATLVRPQPKQRWLLVTSAFHMPRSMGLFEKAGFNVTAFPVAFRTLGEGRESAVGDQSGAQSRDGRDRREGMDRPRRLLGDRPDRPSVSRARLRAPTAR